VDLNNLIQENVLNLIRVYYLLLNTYVNMNIVYFETNHRNGLIYILAYMEIKITKYCLTQRLGLSMLF